MTCAHCMEAADFFGDRMARHELKRFRRRGPTRSTRLLLDALADEEVRDARLLDIGGGVGAVQHVFLERGGAEVTGVDASPAYLAAAGAESARRGTADRVRHLEGDAVELAAALPDADVVTLDRVLCCYPDMPALVDASAARARRAWGVVFPRETWWVRAGVAAINLAQRLRRKAFRVYLHGPDRIEARAVGHGLRTDYRGRTLLWEVRVFRRG
ncbi:MAG: class I SAM-dependent methyltransferase [Longimicrobiales bacterium]|nr:class I SAM-dependent methyltransferase [Longimicrobiales bacterium]